MPASRYWSRSGCPISRPGPFRKKEKKYRADIKRLQGQEHARRKALDDFLTAFSADLYQPLDAPRALVPVLKLQLSPSRGGDRQARRGLPVNETTERRRARRGGAP